jgi:predicted alpha/beta hydrolase family esterase
MRSDRREKRWHRQFEAFLPGWIILRPQMPNSMNAQYAEWEIYFHKVVPFLQEGSTLVGHSLGGNFLLKYLAQNKLPVSIGAIHLVAPCFGVPETDFAITGETHRIVDCAHRVFLHHSTDDVVVPYEDALRCTQAVPEIELVTYVDKGHFIDETFPELIELLQS